MWPRVACLCHLHQERHLPYLTACASDRTKGRVKRGEVGEKSAQLQVLWLERHGNQQPMQPPLMDTGSGELMPV